MSSGGLGQSSGGTEIRESLPLAGRCGGGDPGVVSVREVGGDPAGHVTSIDVVDPAKLVGFSIDALGRHASQTIGSGPSTTYAYLGTSSQISSSVVSGALSTYSAIDAIGDRLTSGTSGGFAYLGVDLHGNVVAAMASGSTPTYLSAYRYDAYGETCDAWNATGNTLAVPWRFQGRRLESASGATDLYDFGARSYDPSLGTFTSFDSVSGSAQNPLTLNRYLYALANPASFVDPSGHTPCVFNANTHRLEAAEQGATCDTSYDDRDQAALTRVANQIAVAKAMMKNGTFQTYSQTQINSLDCVSNPSACAGDNPLQWNMEHGIQHTYVAANGKTITYWDDGTFSNNESGLLNQDAARDACYNSNDSKACTLLQSSGYQQPGTTLGGCLQGGASAALASASGQVCLEASSQGQVSINVSLGGAVGPSASGFSGGAGIESSDTGDLCDLGGLGPTYSASLPLVSASSFSGTDTSGRPFNGMDLDVGLSSPGFSLGLSGTHVFKLAGRGRC